VVLLVLVCSPSTIKSSLSSSARSSRVALDKLPQLPLLKWTSASHDVLELDYLIKIGGLLIYLVWALGRE
jgi:hypothetical protein